MKDVPKLKNDIIDLLRQLSVYIPNSINTQHVVRCPFCGDSHNPSHGHFSIKIDVESDEQMPYRCFKNDETGILTVDVLEELGLNVPPNIRDALNSFNKKIIKKNKFNSKEEKYITPIFNNSQLNSIKLNYINSRLGTSFNFNTAQELKIILDINKFLEINEIKSIPNVDQRYLNILNENYVGFLSTNNNCITLRNINKNKMKRYTKVIINTKSVNSNTFYSIPNTISLMYTNDINVHITEGVFDILSVYNMNNCNKNNNYYFASCGFGYITILKYLIYSGINTGLNIHIYSDNDKTDKDHIDYIFKRSSISHWLKSITFHRNLYPDEKDYGVTLDRIKDSTFKIK